MATSARTAGSTEAAILELLESAGPQRSARRIVAGLGDAGYSEEMVRAAIWRLIDQNRVELTQERELRRRAENA